MLELVDTDPVCIGCGTACLDGPLPPASRIGAKSRNLARMARAGLPVPPGFVLGTEWCGHLTRLEPAHWAEALHAVEQATGRRYADDRHPLILSVRSGAAVSMPGALESVLDVGLSDRTVQGLIRVTGNPALAFDAYRRLVCRFGTVVMGLPSAAFEADERAVARGRELRQLDFDELRRLTNRHLETVRCESGREFPQDPHEQLRQAVRAVFDSWNAPKAVSWRRQQGLGDDAGTAVLVQSMVFGNAGGVSGAGMASTRRPTSGLREPWVDFLFKAQGADLAAATRATAGASGLESTAPELWSELLASLALLEREFGDMQDVEFTLENGRLWLLQARAGRRSPRAQARIALDLLDEGLIDADSARARTRGLDASALGLDRVAAAGSGAEVVVLATAVPASEGVACGEIVLDEARSRDRQAMGIDVLLVRQQADPDDAAGLDGARGLLTAHGGRNSPAAAQARQMGLVCLAGCESLRVDLSSRRIRLGTQELAEGDRITLDAERGAIYRGSVRTVREVPQDLLVRLSRLHAG